MLPNRVALALAMVQPWVSAVRSLAPLAHHRYRKELSKMNYYVNVSVNAELTISVKMLRGFY